MSFETVQYLEELNKRIRKDMNDLADELASGRAADYPSYREMVGKCYGLAEAEAHLKVLLKKARGTTDDEEEDMS